MQKFLNSLTTLEWVLIWALVVVWMIGSILKTVHLVYKIRLKRLRLEGALACRCVVGKHVMDCPKITHGSDEVKP